VSLVPDVAAPSDRTFLIGGRTHLGPRYALPAMGALASAFPHWRFRWHALAMRKVDRTVCARVAAAIAATFFVIACDKAFLPSELNLNYVVRDPISTGVGPARGTRAVTFVGASAACTGLTASFWPFFLLLGSQTNKP